jgi:hypothetical protein
MLLLPWQPLAYLIADRSRQLIVIGFFGSNAYAALDQFAQSRLAVALMMILLLGHCFSKACAK